VLRFHLDENVDVALAQALIRRGFDVSTASSAGLVGADDLEHLAFALREGRVLVTHDTDFLRLAAKGKPHAGIAFSNIRARTITEMLLALQLLAECYESAAMHGHVEYI
jgi:predicted nuclease of predicted toxin-antitoxin system